MWYNEKFVYYSNSPGFYEIYFLGKKLFWCYMRNWDVKIPDKEKKSIIVSNTNLVWCLLDCLFCLSKLLLLLLPWWLPPLSSPLIRRARAARRASPGTLRIAGGGGGGVYTQVRACTRVCFYVCVRVRACSSVFARACESMCVCCMCVRARVCNSKV